MAGIPSSKPVVAIDCLYCPTKPTNLNAVKAMNMTTYDMAGRISNPDVTVMSTFLNALNNGLIDPIVAPFDMLMLDFETAPWVYGPNGAWAQITTYMPQLWTLVQAYKARYPTKTIGFYNAGATSGSSLQTGIWSQAAEISDKAWSDCFAPSWNKYSDFVIVSCYFGTNRNFAGWSRRTDWALTQGGKVANDLGLPFYAVLCPRNANDWTQMPADQFPLLYRFLCNHPAVDGVILWDAGLGGGLVWDEAADWVKAWREVSGV